MRPTPRPVGGQGIPNTVQGKFTILTGRLLYKIYDARWYIDATQMIGSNVHLVKSRVKEQLGKEAWKQFVQDVCSEEEVDPKQGYADIVSEINKLVGQSRRVLEQEVLDNQTGEGRVDQRRWQQQQSNTTFSFMTQNIEKYGKRSKKKPQKVQEISRTVTATNPDVFSTQEVTNQEMFIRDIRGQLPDYEPLEGAEYQSKPYVEGYPGFFNTATIHQKPELFYIDPQTGETTEYTDPLLFGKARALALKDKNLKQARPTSFWEFHIPSGRYNLRPPEKYFSSKSSRRRYKMSHSNLEHRRYHPYERVRYINVHTSPGRSTPTINQQVTNILDEMKSLQEEVPNTIASGDFYMQKGSKRNWNALEQGREGVRSLHPNVKTNYKKHQGKQIADHFVIPQTWQSSHSFALPPSTHENESLSSKIRRGRDERELAKWEDSNVDHTPVYGISNVPSTNPQQILVNEIMQFFTNIIYRQNNCLIYAIAGAAHVQVTFNVLTAIRNELSDRFQVPIGGFIAARSRNIKVIMRHLKLHGIVSVRNVENVHHAALPIFVEQTNGSQNVDITINYSTDHFWASPRD